MTAMTSFHVFAKILNISDHVLQKLLPPLRFNYITSDTENITASFCAAPHILWIVIC